MLPDFYFKKGMASKHNLTAELIDYIETEILPRYDAFDKAHDRTHAIAVLVKSLRLAQHYDVNIAMVYAIAAYHDLGLVEGREQHHTASARIIREDKRLKKLFIAEEIETMADAERTTAHPATHRHAPYME